MAETRRMITSKGDVFDSTLTDSEAIEGLKAVKDSRFAQSLLSNYAEFRRLTPSQLIWAHFLVMGARKPAPVVSEIGNLSGVLNLFSRARSKYPKIHLTLLNGNRVYPVCLSVAGSRSSYPGSINVTDGGGWNNSKFYGRIDRDGRFTRRTEAPNGLAEFLAAFAEAPEKLAAEHGKMTGACSFCNRHLTDNRSVSVGYGPDCAGYYGLPWGAAAAAAVAPYNIDQEPENRAWLRKEVTA